MYAIETKYMGPTNTRGSRILAKGNDKRVTVSYPYDKSGEDVHRVALAAFLESCEYLTDEEKNANNWIGGSTSTGYVFVYVGNRFCQWKSHGMTYESGCEGHSMWSRLYKHCPSCGGELKIVK